LCACASYVKGDMFSYFLKTINNKQLCGILRQALVSFIIQDQCSWNMLLIPQYDYDILSVMKHYNITCKQAEHEVANGVSAWIKYHYK